jgi:3-isopropylmalate dehydratase small subunit
LNASIEEARDARISNGDSLASIIGCGLGMIAEYISRGSFRNAINAGLPLLTGCKGVAGDVKTGDDLEINFKMGEFKNLSRDITRQFQPLDEQLQAIIEAGGWRANLEKRIANLRSGESAVA